MTSTWLEVQLRRSAGGFDVKNRENFRSSFLGQTWPTHIYLDKLEPNLPSLRAWVAVLSRNPPKRLLDRLHAMHSVWSTMVIHSFLSPSRLPHGPSEVLHSCRSSAPPCAKPPWPADVKILILASCPSEVFCLGPSRSSLLLTITHPPRAMRPVHWLSDKIMSRFLASRLSPHLEELGSHSQSAFIKGRSINDNFQYIKGAIRHFH